MVAASDTVGAPTPPRFLGDFELLREIGRGGMAVVYLARQRSLDRVIALKLLPLERTASSRDIERFYREATLVAKLHHQNVVPVHAVGEVMGSHFIAMDFIAGPSLAEILEAVRGRVAAEVAHGPFPWPADGDVPRPGNLGSYIEGTCRIAAGIARALAHAHDQGVIHRDVKPGNILIDASGVSLLTDFGLAHVDGSATLTLSGDFAGTPYYVSPEQIEPRRGPIDGRSDVYALGATLYQMLTLRPPFEGVTPVQIFRAKLIGEPLPARRLNPSLPRDLETIVHHCLEREPGDRYATASELADDLERFLSYLPIRARRTASWLRAVKLARRHRGTVATAIGAAVVMAVILFALRVHERGAEARSQDARRIAAIAAIDAAIDHGDLVAAEAALGDVVRFASPTELTRNRQRVDALRAASLLDQARAKLASLVACIENQERLRQELEEGESKLRLEYFDDDRRGRLHQLRRIVPEQVAEPDRQATVIEGLLTQASESLERAQAPANAVQALFADLYITLYRRACSADRTGEADSYRARVLRWDAAQRYGGELSEQGWVDLWEDASPRYLFRYVEDVLQPGRVVPQPYRQPDSPYLGEALEVESVTSGAAVRPGDLITSLDDESATRGLLVEWVGRESRAAAAGVTPFARVVSMNERPVLDTGDWSLPFDLHQATLRAVFAMPTREVALAAQTFVPEHPNQLFGMFVNRPHRVLEREAPPFDLTLSLVRDGECLQVTLAAGGASRIVSRPTANPLVRSGSSRVSPGERRLALKPGSYLLLSESLRRLPFEVASGRVTALPPPPPLDCPEGYRLIPAGPFHYGGDGSDWGGHAQRIESTDVFCIGEHEVTAGEWFEFLNDPEVQPRALAEFQRGGSELLPVTSRHSLVRYDRELLRLLPNTNERAPITELSRVDVRAYLEWLNRRLATSGWLADLPTSLEFEKAARGADRRPYPWGHSFDPRYANSFYCRREQRTLDPVMGRLDDESPYGVHDLAGSVQEWTRDVPPGGTGYAIVKGGSYMRREPADFRISSRNILTEELKSPEIGFRVVLRQRP